MYHWEIFLRAFYKVAFYKNSCVGKSKFPVRKKYLSQKGYTILQIGFFLRRLFSLSLSVSKVYDLMISVVPNLSPTLRPHLPRILCMIQADVIVTKSGYFLLSAKSRPEFLYRHL